MSSSTNSSTLAPHKYEVFLSFRGEDTRYGFVSHLFKALSDKGIKTYIDDKSLERGDEISHSLLQAIQESKASVVVFSENYASSSWCLDELVGVLECKERHGQIVVPVFYRVEPTHVRKREGRFGEAFSRLEERFAGSVEKVNEWRTALSTASDLSGWHLNGTSPEADVVEEIVEAVKRKLNGMSQPNEDFKGLVGMKKRIDEIESLLCLSTRDAVCVIGIWGMGGIGKTTLADAAFKKFSYRFEGCCFLRNVREEWANTTEKESLKEKLHSQIFREQNPYNAENRLREKKVLIVLDDIDDEDQLKLLVGDCNGIGSGSRVIVTTRNEQMVRYLEADDVETKLYPVDELNYTEALQLFNLKASKGQSSKADQYTNEISEEVVNYAKGIPLALAVLGSFLRCRKKEEWKSYLNQLKEEPHDKIQKVLKVSYDGLNKKDQSIFLDIACFFKGRERGTIEEILDACYVSPNFCAKTRISNLIERALITVIGRGSEILQMHDLVQEMGHEIASSNNIEPGKRSRLWNAEAIFDVLKNNSGTETIEGISLNLTSNIKMVGLGPSAFEGMHNLRFLEIITSMAGSKVVFPGGIRYLPNALRYLRWDQCQLKFFPSNFTAQNLVELNVKDSQLKQLWNGVQNLVNLRHINLIDCHNLTRIPDLSRAAKLETIYIRFCQNLVEVPPLNFQVSGNHTSLQKNFRKDIGTLLLKNCYIIKHLPNISGNVKRLDLSCSGIHEIPSSIKNLSKLIELRVRFCWYLKALPQLPLSLRLLDATGCKSLVTVATSQSAVIQAHREDYHVTHYEKFQFLICPRLDRNSRQSLMTESHIRVLRTAILSVSKAVGISNLFKDDKPGVQMCIPGDEIPKWFRYQSEKSQITIKLPPNWHANFIGFALCTVAHKLCLDYFRRSSVSCKYSFKTSDDHEDHRTYIDHWQNDMIGSSIEYPLEDHHSFIWYSREDYRDYHGATEISFEFQKPYSFNIVKRCGIHMLYRQEVEELGIDENGMTYEQNNDQTKKKKRKWS